MFSLKSTYRHIDFYPVLMQTNKDKIRNILNQKMIIFEDICGEILLPEEAEKDTAAEMAEGLPRPIPRRRRLSSLAC